MKKLVYILIAFVVFLSFTAVNIFAGEVNKAKEAEKIFAKAIAQDNGCNLSIDAQNVSDDEMKMVIEKFHYDPVKKGSGGDNNEDPPPPPKEDDEWKDQLWQYYTLLQFNNPYDRANW